MMLTATSTPRAIHNLPATATLYRHESGALCARWADGERTYEAAITPTQTEGEYQRGEAVRPSQLFTVLGDGQASARLVLVNLVFMFLNLLPILPLDGGHVAGALYEGARRKVARWQGRPDPGPVDVARMLPVAYTVAMVLIVMSVIILWADIVKPIRLG